MPMILSELNNDRYEDWESLLFVSLEDVKEVVILKEAHGSVCNLEMDSTNASDDAFK